MGLSVVADDIIVKIVGIVHSRKKSDVTSSQICRMALEMYLEGLGFRAIGRILKISCVTVYYWVQQWSENVSLFQQEECVNILELYEMHTYVGSKNYCWIWIAVDRLGKRALSFVCGDRSTKRGESYGSKYEGFLSLPIVLIIGKTMKNLSLAKNIFKQKQRLIP